MPSGPFLAAFLWVLCVPLQVDWLHRGIYRKHAGMAVDFNGAAGRMRDWNAAVDEYIANGHDSRSKTEVRLGFQGRALCCSHMLRRTNIMLLNARGQPQSMDLRAAQWRQCWHKLEGLKGLRTTPTTGLLCAWCLLLTD